jgi:hypothetical protein
MATKAEQLRATQERQRKKPAKKSPKRRTAERRVVDEMKRDTSGRPAGGRTARRNIKASRTKKAKDSFSLEDSGSGRPSRKSTRKASNRVKPDANLRGRQTRRTRSPEQRAAKAEARRTAVR